MATADALSSASEWWKQWFELTKPRLSMLTVITAIVGYLSALPLYDLGLFLCLIGGTSLAAGGAAALNMWMERDIDAKMKRTQGRPIPSGIVKPSTALASGILLCLAGDALLLFGVNTVSASLALLTQISYILAYTPLKRITPWNTELGAIPGAIPPLIGWAAADAEIGLLGWTLFAILLFWQIPHFMAIAWLYRKDYRQGGLVMLTTIDDSGKRAALRSLSCAVIMGVVSVLPWVMGFTSAIYGVAAVLMAVWFTKKAIDFKQAEERDPPARKLFLASIAYLPALLSLLVIDRWLLVSWLQF